MVSTGDSKSLSLGSNPGEATMNTTFKYQGKIISTPNLGKKLKRMKISIDDIEIIETQEPKKQEKEEYDEDEYENVNLITPLKEGKIVIRVPKGTRPNLVEYLKKFLWDPVTKTGIKEYTIEFLKTLEYERII